MISIVIPLYNAEQVIQRCLNSLLKQTVTDIEILCINDGSADNTLRLLKECYPHYSHIKIITILHGGPGRARNIGVKIAKGDYIFFCDADDYIEADMLEKMAHNIENNNSDVVCCDFIEDYEEDMTEHCLEDDSLFEMFFYETAVWNKLFRREFLISNNVCFPDSSRGEDRVFLACCYVKNPKITYEKGFYYHWIRDGYKGNSLNKVMSLDDFEERLNNWEQFIIILGEKHRKSALKNITDGKQYIDQLCCYIPDYHERDTALNRVKMFYQKYCGC